MKKGNCTWLLVVALLAAPFPGLDALPVFGQPPSKPAPSKDSFAQLKQEYDEAVKKFQDEAVKATLHRKTDDLHRAAEKADRDAKTIAEKNAAVRQMQGVEKTLAIKFPLPETPARKFSRRFLEFGESNPNDMSALESIVLALASSEGPSGKVATWGPGIKTLQARYVEKPEIKKSFRWLSRSLDLPAEQLLREIIARNPSRKTQALACRTLASGLEEVAELSEQFDGDESPTTRAYLEAMVGKERVAEMIAKTGKAKKDAKEMRSIFKENYADVFPDLSIGKSAPEVVSQEVTGKRATLSALKGKIVVLDIWTTWCPPCRGMIPHEREMVDRLKGKSFALVSISADEKRETLTDFLAKEKLPWTQWWDGWEGGILEDWNIDGYPTIYVLDAQGVIRYKDIRGEELEAAVNVLLKELQRRR